VVNRKSSLRRIRCPEKRQEKDREKTFSEKLADFISANRISGYRQSALPPSWSSRRSALHPRCRGISLRHRAGQGTLRIKKLQAWSQETDEQKKADAETSLITDLDSIATKWPRTLAAQRALLRKGAILSQKKDTRRPKKWPWTPLQETRNPTQRPSRSARRRIGRGGRQYRRAIAHFTTLTKDYLKDNPSAPSALCQSRRLAGGQTGL
jgi:hypothetical protein